MDETKYTLAEHLTELRSRLLKSLLAIVVTTATCLAFASELLSFSTRPIEEVLAEKTRVNVVVAYPRVAAREKLLDAMSDQHVEIIAAVDTLAAMKDAVVDAKSRKKPVDLVLVAATLVATATSSAETVLEGVDVSPPAIAYLFGSLHDPHALRLSLEGASAMTDPPRQSALLRVIKNAAATAGKASKTDKLVMLSPLEPFFAYMKIALVCGLFLACPVWLYQAWRFVEPGLYRHEKGMVVPIVLGASVLFVVGGLFAYFAMFPLMFDVIVNQMMPSQVVASFTVDNYLNLLFIMTVAFGLVFEVPLVIAVLAMMGVVTPTSLARYRKFAVIAAFVVSAIVTPTADPLSQTLMAAPLYLFYEVGIVLARVMVKRRERGLAAERT